MKKILMAAMLVVLTACQSVDLTSDTPESSNSKNFTFHVKGDFIKSFEDMTRAAVRLEDNNTAGVTDLWVLDYVDGTLAQQAHQSSTDAEFGTVPMSLTYGHHDIKFIASKGDTPSLTATALSWQKVKDTFTLDYPVDVVASSNGNRAPELKRAVAGVSLAMTDAIPTGVTKVEVALSDRYNSLALPSLEVGGKGEFKNTFAFSASDAGTKLLLKTYSLAPDDVWTTNVTVKAYKGETVVSDFTVENVELKKNRLTTLTGEVFNRTNGFQVSVDDTWDDGLNVTF